MSCNHHHHRHHIIFIFMKILILLIDVSIDHVFSERLKVKYYLRLYNIYCI